MKKNVNCKPSPSMDAIFEGITRGEFMSHGEAINRIKDLKHEVADLKRELESKQVVFVGYTNGDQIESSKKDSGCFYPETDGECYIPVYMLKIHKHRIESTKSTS